eukprot:339292-Pelagomonas_calceolata.AAC.1
MEHGMHGKAHHCVQQHRVHGTKGSMEQSQWTKQSVATLRCTPGMAAGSGGQCWANSDGTSARLIKHIT